MIFQNTIVQLVALFIPNKKIRHDFRTKYKRKTKFRKLRDDNRSLFNEVNFLKEEIAYIKQALWEINREARSESSITPIDDFIPPGPKTNVYLSIACIAKNEGSYIKEWIEYHKLIGVERFYFYDNESTDNTKEVLEPYIKTGTVVYRIIKNNPVKPHKPQLEAFKDAVYKYKNQTRWMALIDLDEFIVPVEKDSLKEFLKDYEPFPGIAVNWVVFDSNGHDKRPTEHSGLVTANYTRVRKDYSIGRNIFVKSIVNPKRVVNIVTAHYPFYYMDFYNVTENFEPARGEMIRHSSSKIRINHYESKSREEYEQKLLRNSKVGYKNYQFDKDQVNFTTETTDDLVIQRFIPKLKKAMKIID